ncbi:MAG: exodeoxyribonuclease I [Granulosicoccus sp.]|nr:exodeoxyribonuclease I [Granulosicoccus sp.]
MSFYWFDYETFGTHPAWDRPCQFAGVRTDEKLAVIGEPMTVYCQQPSDYLPSPGACRVTGITPQLANEKGVCEAEFMQQIVREIGQPHTCSVGYNSIRFDDEFTRHALFRNLQDPYEYEWKDGNSRWDLIDVVRLARALRPEGIQWPVNEDGSASNRLEHLSFANGIEHGHAHDAMSDVWATIGMARLLRQKQPRLFEYLFANRGKASVSRMLNTRERRVCLQVSGMIPGNRHNLGAIFPLVRHPQNSNGVIVLDLQHDPRYLLDMDADEIARQLFLPGSERSENDAPRPGLRTVHINKCPVIVPLSTLRDEDAMRLQMDRQQILQHAQWAQPLCNEQTLEKIQSAMTRHWEVDPAPDVDGTLYSGAFLSQADRQRLRTILAIAPDKLASELPAQLGHFEDRRLNEMVWRYQARNYPQSLDTGQQRHWAEHCATRLNNCDAAWLCLRDYLQQLDEEPWQKEEKSLEQALRRYPDELGLASLPECEQ